MANKVAITKQAFDNAKLMLSTGKISQQKISDILGVCPSTISYIKHSSNYEDYFQRLAAHNEKNRNAKKAKAQKAVDEEKKSKTAAQVIEHKQTIQVQATHYMMEEMKKTNEYLKLISNKLAFIVDELTK